MAKTVKPDKDKRTCYDYFDACRVSVAASRAVGETPAPPGLDALIGIPPAVVDKHYRKWKKKNKVGGIE